MNNTVHISFCIFSQVIFGIKSKTLGLLGQRINSHVILLHTVKFSSTRVSHFVPTWVRHEAASLSLASPTECAIKLVYVCQFGEKQNARWGFNVHFSYYEWAEHLFICLRNICRFFSGFHLFISFAHFSIGLVIFASNFNLLIHKHTICMEDIICLW